jgi:deoxyribodipyrimidine photo-lyase
MTTKFDNGLFIFRRDLRIIDNNGLNLLNEKCKNIYTIFIFTPEQVGSGNKYKSDNSVQFMIESLEDLSYQISKSGGHLYTFYGHNDKVVADCIKAWDINVVCFNLDISPYAKERDEKIIKLCEHMNTYIMYDYDYYLHQPGTIVNGSKDPYQKFTPYYLTCLKKKVESPAGPRKIHFKQSESQIPNKISLEQAFKKFIKENPNILVHGGRPEAIQTLKTAVRTQTHYPKTHNELDKQTTQLSAYLKFGCISIREAYKALHGKRDIIRQLIWRDFYANIFRWLDKHQLCWSRLYRFSDLPWSMDP